MSDENRPGPHPAPPSEPVVPRPLTKQLVEAIAFDVWPGNAAAMDFGLNSQEHYEALYYPVRNGEITAEQLERALGSGPRLTELANAAPSNPHKGIVFWTAWDELRPEPNPAPDPGRADSPGPPAAAFEAMLRDYRGNTSWYFEERDGSPRTWPELSPEGKLGYLARDAALAGVVEEHFAAAVREFLGDLPAERREAAALNLALGHARELRDVARLLPDHPTSDQLPLAERVKDAIEQRQAPQSVLGYSLDEPHGQDQPRTRGR